MVIQNKYAYGYRYDGRGNVVKKLLPAFIYNTCVCCLSHRNPVTFYF